MVEFAINNSVYVSTELTLFFVNHARHPRVPALLAVGLPATSVLGASLLVGGESPVASPAVQPVPAAPVTSGVIESPDEPAPVASSLVGGASLPPTPLSRDASPRANATAAWTMGSLIAPTGPCTRGLVHRATHSAEEVHAATSHGAADVVPELLLHRQSVIRYVRDAITHAVDKQKEIADNRGRRNLNVFNVGDRVLLSTVKIRPEAVTNLGANKLLPRYIGPFKVIKKIGDAYTLELPPYMQLHPTFYVGVLPLIPSRSEVYHAWCSCMFRVSGKRTAVSGRKTAVGPKERKSGPR